MPRYYLGLVFAVLVFLMPARADTLLEANIPMHNATTTTVGQKSLCIVASR